MRETSAAVKWAGRRFGTRLRLAAALMALGLAGAGCDASGSSHTQASASASSSGTAKPSASSSASASSSSGGGVVRALTDAGSTDPGVYYVDPYPIHTAASDGGAGSVYFSGTTKSLLHCVAGASAHCRAEGKVKVSVGSGLRRAAGKYGSRTTVTDNSNIYQLDSGSWQMATTMYVKNPRFPDAPPWTVIVHAHPAPVAHGSGGAVPTQWVADSLLAGSFQRPDKANYDGKYFEDGSKLYLIYSKRLSNAPAQDGIVAQPMASPGKPAGSAPSVLLAPENTGGGYNSELFFGMGQPKKFKLIETGNITKVDGKYVMAYSTGAFNEDDYKSGLAWSDSLIPSNGASYRRLLIKDDKQVWAGKPGGYEVEYLLQSQVKDWPNYVGDRVLAPGVPSVVRADGKWYLFFAGYLPSDAPKVPGRKFDASHRRPFVMPLAVHVPKSTSVRAASNDDLAHWITWP
ncbi:hypothetical protein [Streptomyces sp. NRRL F-5126]|uniref:hypothetical protein n=1 Tax=Streptomyces sp. NRRL F-5126 TaxID=1463857 RepID=UPI00131B3ACF|nr:hypothetical protein [Streptomyces sp. NRRL F-5126]